jgi:flagellar motor switch protein FliN/FliY
MTDPRKDVPKEQEAAKPAGEAAASAAAQPEKKEEREKVAASVASAMNLSAEMTALGHVPVEVQVVLGRTKLPISQILKLGRGAVVEIDRKVGEQVEIHLNHRPVARGEIVIVDDDRLGVTITEIVGPGGGIH